MDKLKEATIKDYTSWDINCPYIGSRKWKIRLKRIFKRKARRNQKIDLRKELKENGI